mgnify:CR=1 FL=1
MSPDFLVDNVRNTVIKRNVYKIKAVVQNENKRYNKVR